MIRASWCPGGWTLDDDASGGRFLWRARQAGTQVGKHVGKAGGQSRQVGPGQQTMAGRGAGRSDGGLAG